MLHKQPFHPEHTNEDEDYIYNLSNYTEDKHIFSSIVIYLQCLLSHL